MCEKNYTNKIFKYFKEISFLIQGWEHHVFPSYSGSQKLYP